MELRAQSPLIIFKILMHAFFFGGTVNMRGVVAVCSVIRTFISVFNGGPQTKFHFLLDNVIYYTYNPSVKSTEYLAI
jgi:hypothetical protein